MGKPPASSSPPTPEADAISLNTQPDNYFDDDAPSLTIDPDDLPPLYSDHDEASGSGSGIAPDQPSAPLLPQRSVAPVLHSSSVGSFLVDPFSRDDSTGTEYYTDPRLSSDPTFLQNFIKERAKIPPRQLVRIHGWHKETVKQGGKTERKQVTDFDIHTDLTPYLYRNAPQRKSWQWVRVAGNWDKVRRGTVFRTEEGPAAQADAENAQLIDESMLEAWCHRFCASNAGMKCFRLQRQVTGLDTALLHSKLMYLRQSTNYRGHMEVSFPVRDAIVDVYNPSKINEWRLTRWICWIFYLSFLWLFTWPYLFFFTKRWEVVYSVWPFSRPSSEGAIEYASFSEERWYGMWGRVIHNAILLKRQGTIEPHEIDALDRRGPPVFETGNAGVDSALGFVAASVAAFGEVNRATGWGFDTA